MQGPPCTQAKPHPRPLTGQPQGRACWAPAPSGWQTPRSLRARSLALQVAHVKLFGFPLAALMSSRLALAERPP